MNRRLASAVIFLAFFALALLAPTVRADDAAPVVVLKTTMGEIDIQLDAKKAPVTTKNFLDYVDAHFYDGTIFHRIIAHFVVQGGGFTTNLEEKPTRPPIVNEASNGLLNYRGTISMARTPDPNSATSQFFLNLDDNSVKLGPGGADEYGYAVFGKIIKGLDVIDKMATVETGTKGGMSDVPDDNIVIITARRK